jgi:uncharacterized protein (DUF1919 family)
MIRRYLNDMTDRVEKIRIGDAKFAIVSNNCWGAGAYKAARRPYNTPFVGLFLYPDCYLELLENFGSYIQADIKFGNRSKYFCNDANYPIGYLNDNVEVHFLHYASAEEASEKWKRRSARLRRDIAQGVPVFFKLCDREGCTYDHFSRFHALPFSNKLSIGVGAFASECHKCVPTLQSVGEESVMGGLQLFRIRYRYFDFSHWIVKKRIATTMTSSVLGLLS